LIVSPKAVQNYPFFLTPTNFFAPVFCRAPNPKIAVCKIPKKTLNLRVYDFEKIGKRNLLIISRLKTV